VFKEVRENLEKLGIMALRPVKFLNSRRRGRKKS